MKMNNLLEYKGYVGKFDIDLDAGIFQGEIMYLKDIITF